MSTPKSSTTIMCQIWHKDEKYLRKFISHHASIGIHSFLFIIDEYTTPFHFPDSEFKQYSASSVKGISTASDLGARQRQNYNYWIKKINTDYVCVLDIDEFLHPDTLKLLEQTNPQSINLPWRIMCVDILGKGGDEGYQYSGITVPRIKSISKVEDIRTVGVHKCTFDKHGEAIKFGKCTHIPINHYYVRDGSDLELFQSYEGSDRHFLSRFSTMTVMRSLCMHFSEFSQTFKLSSHDNETTGADQLKSTKNNSSEDSIQYLYLFIKAMVLMSKLNGIEYEVGIRQYPKIMRDLNKYKSHFEKLRYLILLSNGIKKKAEKGIDKKGCEFSVLSIYSIHLFEDASNPTQSGLEIFQNDFNLLLAASSVCRALGDREKSLEYAELLITHHPDHWNGYVRSAQDLIALKRSEEAQAILQTGLNKFPNQKKLQKISEQHYRN